MNTRRLFFFTFFILFGVALVAGSFSLLKNSPRTAGEKNLTPLSLAFDWTPNTNHTGIYVALANDWYAEEGIELKILPYSGTVSTDVVVNAGTVDLGISSTEAITADAAAGAPVVSIAAILAHNTSSLAVVKDSGITHPSELDGKIYGGYGASFEEPVI